MSDDSSTALFFVIVFVILLFVGFLVIFINKDLIFGKAEPKDALKASYGGNNSYIKFRTMEFGANLMINANYYIYGNKSYCNVTLVNTSIARLADGTKFLNGTKVISCSERYFLTKSGRTNSNSFETIEHLEGNMSYIIKAYDDDNKDADYYPSEIECRSNETCNIWLKKEGKINATLSLSNGSGTLSIHAIEGLVNEPIAIVRHPFSVRNMSIIGVPRIKVPKERQQVFDGFDEAFKLESVYYSDKSYDLHYDKAFDYEGDILICVLDLAYKDGLEPTYDNSDKLGISDYCVNATI